MATMSEHLTAKAAGQNGNGRAHDLSSGQVRPATPTSRPQSGSVKEEARLAVAIKSKEEILLSLTGELPAPAADEKVVRAGTTSAEGLTKTIYTKIKDSQLVRWTVYIKALLADKRSATSPEIKKISEGQNAARIEADLAKIPSLIGKLFANFILTLIELKEILNGKDTITPADFRSALMDTRLITSGVLVEHTTEPRDVPKALRGHIWSYTKLSGSQCWCQLNPELALIDSADLADMKGIIDTIFLMSEEARAAELQEQEARRLAVAVKPKTSPEKEKKGHPVVDVATGNKEYPAAIPPAKEKILTLDEILSGVVGVTNPVTIEGGLVQLRCFVEQGGKGRRAKKGKLLVTVVPNKTHPRYHDFPPSSFGIAPDQLADAFHGKRSMDFSWAPTPRLRQTLEDIATWAMVTLEGLDRVESERDLLEWAKPTEEQQATPVAEEAPVQKEVVAASEAITEKVVENAGTEPAPEATADTKETGFALVAPATSDEPVTAEAPAAVQ